MSAYQINMNCPECPRNGEHSRCDVHKLFHRLNILVHEQAVLWNMASEKMNCESFRNILLLLQDKTIK
jgi:hypothetical protein